MSDPGVPQEQPSPPKHEPGATRDVQTVGDAPIKEISSLQHVDGPSEDINAKDVDQSRTPAVGESATQIGTGSDMPDDAGGSGPTADTATSGGNPGDLARAMDIEREASEHLAKWAAAMRADDDDGGAQTSGQVTEPSVPADHDASRESEPPARPGKDTPALALDTKQDEFDEKHPPKDDPQNEIPEAPQGTTETTGAEIQNIMDQFQEGMGGLGEQEIMSPRLERQSMLILPPRSSSLEPKDKYIIGTTNPTQSVTAPLARDLTGGSTTKNKMRSISDDQESIRSTRSGSIFQPPPPSPDPEPALPFDFHRFLEQLKHRTADPVARFLRSFLNEFGKRQWMVHEQVKIISDFLEFITKKMGQCEVWRTVSDAEFDNAREGMEKLVMSRLYSQTFSPSIPPLVGSPRKSRGGRSQADSASPHGPGRRGQHQEDVERDDVIAQKIDIYGWIKEEHLDITPVGQKGRKFLGLAQKELLKINAYRAPRDKVICVLNCCKVIFGFLKNSKADQSADAFVPLLIYTVLQARPEHLVSNVQYIWRFRNQEKLGGEAGYYMSSLMGVVTFIENLDRTTLTITDEEFEKNVEQAVSAIAEKNRAFEYEERSHAPAAPGPMQHLNEKSHPSRPQVTPRNSTDAEQSTPRRIVTARTGEKTSAADDDGDTMTGLLRTIQKPLSTIGRMFSDETPQSQLQAPRSVSPARTPPPPGSGFRGLSPGPKGDQQSRANRQQRQQFAEDAAARQASAEAAQAQSVRLREHQVVVETLQSMFPNLDKEVIEDVVRAQEGNVGRAVDACLALSG